MDKINFIKALSTTHKKGFSEKNIKSVWRTTSNWPISYVKALTHPECQADKDKHGTKQVLKANKDMPKSRRNIKDLTSLNPLIKEQLKYRKVGITFNYKQAKLVLTNKKIANLKAQIKRIRAKKRRSIPNLNRRFMQLAEILGGKKKDRNTLT